MKAGAGAGAGASIPGAAAVGHCLNGGLITSTTCLF